MQVEVFTIADAATEFGGKLNLLGSFDTINVQNLPFNLPTFTIALKVRAFTGEPINQKVEIDIKKPDRSNLIDQFTSFLNFNFQPQIDSATAHVLINLQGIPFDQIGVYKIILTKDNVTLITLPLYVRKLN